MGRQKQDVTKSKALITMDELEKQEISEYAELLGWSKSKVHEEMRRIGRSEFSKRYIEPALKKKEEEKTPTTEEEECEDRKRRWHEYLRAAAGRGY